ncbi:alcohol dehydrogenase [Ilyonectria robusta]
MFTPHGAFAEYAITWAHTTFRLPANISFEEAATCHIYRDIGFRMYHAIEAFFFHHRRPSPPASSSASSPIS